MQHAIYQQNLRLDCIDLHCHVERVSILVHHKLSGSADVELWVTVVASSDKARYQSLKIPLDRLGWKLLRHWCAEA